MPDVFLLDFEIYFIGVHEYHFIVVPELDEGGLHYSFTCDYIVAILVCAHGSGEPLEVAILVEDYDVVGVDVSG